MGIDLTFYGYGVGMVMFFWLVGSILGAIFRLFSNHRFFGGSDHERS